MTRGGNKGGGEEVDETPEMPVLVAVVAVAVLPVIDGGGGTSVVDVDVAVDVDEIVVVVPLAVALVTEAGEGRGGLMGRRRGMEDEDDRGGGVGSEEAIVCMVKGLFEGAAGWCDVSCLA